jgi:hypothetical protein
VIQLAGDGSTLAGVCDSCAFPRSPRVKAVASPGPKVRIVDIAQVKSGWIARGQVQQGGCPLCGAAYVTLVRYIPTERRSSYCRAAQDRGGLPPNTVAGVGKRVSERANADANNRSGRAWTAAEPATARTGAEQASGTGLDRSGHVPFDFVMRRYQYIRSRSGPASAGFRRGWAGAAGAGDP